MVYLWNYLKLRIFANIWMVLYLGWSDTMICMNIFIKLNQIFQLNFDFGKKLLLPQTQLVPYNQHLIRQIWMLRLCLFSSKFPLKLGPIGWWSVFKRNHRVFCYLFSFVCSFAYRERVFHHYVLIKQYLSAIYLC